MGNPERTTPQPKNQMKSLREILPRASQSVIDANPQYSSQADNQNAKAANVTRTRRGSMNSTEAEYALMLEHMRKKGEILRWVFEGITLRWEGVKYTPDFVVFCCQAIECPSPTETTVFQHIKLIEIKGGYLKGKYERAIERFRHARSMWPEFAFEMHQKTKSGWKRIH